MCHGRAMVSSWTKDMDSAVPTEPGPHHKNPRHEIFAKGWVAQKKKMIGT